MEALVNSTSEFFEQQPVLYSWGAIAGAGILVLAVFSGDVFRRYDKSGIPYKAGIPFVGAWDFFTKRHRFLDEGIKSLGPIYSFNILQHKVVTVAGEQARKVFFGDKDLSFLEGYKVLFGGAPMLKDIKIEKERDEGDMSWFQKRITAILKRDRLAKIIPLMFQDLDVRFKDWGKSGTLDPFDKVYNLVFQLTVRGACCKEIADDPEQVRRLAEAYWAVEKGSTPATVLFPWLPSAARKKRNAATVDLYILIKGHLDSRRADGRREEDAVQVLLDEGDADNDIVQFIMGSLFAGIINTGIMSSWILLYLQANPEWKAKATAEVRSFITKYAQEGTASVSEQLSQVPPQAWEDEMPVLDVCLRETIRITLTGATLRRVMPSASTPTINGHKLQQGSFLAYPVADVHHNPDIYPEPMKWDPNRYARGEDKKQHWAFIGWGTGRHPCLGMRFAKLEVKIILALFLTQFEYDIVDPAGRKMTKLPEPYRDNMYQVPPSKPVYIRYNRVD